MSGVFSVRAWNTAAVCLRVMTISNAMLLGYVHLVFAVSHPDYYAQAWPSFSRALSNADLTFYRWLAAAAGLCQIIGGAAMAHLHLRQAAGAPIPRVLLTAALAWGLASALGIVHYLHMTIVVDSGPHMILSYVYFFGMTIFIVADAAAMATIHGRNTSTHHIPLMRAARSVAIGVVLSGLTFLVTHFLRDAAWNSRPLQTQKLFVSAEVAWVILCHVYVLLRLRLMQPRPGLSSGRSYAARENALGGETGAAEKGTR